MPDELKEKSAETVATRNKRSVAAMSVGAAVFLTTIKLIAGLWTGSLGILAEAAHSGLDLAATIITYLAVRISDKPADAEHTYGHGKIENLSALVETLLLLVTCIWIIYESIHRLLYHVIDIDVSLWAFLTIVTSIVVNVKISRMLSHTARRHHSQALEADALHFSTDIWSSSVVLGGLIIVWLGQHAFPAYAELLAKADPLAALGVAAIVIYVSYQLGKRTIDVLLDRAPEGLLHKIAEAARKVEGVLNTSQLRVRRSGPHVFVDMSVDVARNLPFERTHAIAEAVEEQVRLVARGADVVVHTDPREEDEESIAERIRTIVSKNQLSAHNIIVQETHGRISVDLHLEVSDHLSLRLAHDLASRVEQEVRADMPVISQVNTHIESMAGGINNGLDVTEREGDLVRNIIMRTNDLVGQDCCHDVAIHRHGKMLAVSLHCNLEDDLSVTQVHDVTTYIESRLQEEFPALDRILVHAEPLGKH